MDLPARKPNRLPEYDYSAPGAYFITICPQNRACIFWDAVGASIARPQTLPLSKWGMLADTAIRNIPHHYPAVSVDTYVIMPNHIHLLLQIHTDADGRPTPQGGLSCRFAAIHLLVAPTISTVVQQLKGVITKQIGHSVWQKLFHDHVIRNEQDYLKIWEYIENNPARWEEDCFYEETLL